MSRTSHNTAPGRRAGSAAFPNTRWSLVCDLREGDGGRGDAALAELCQLYWYPVYAFVRRSGHGSEDAQDLTQSFFALVLSHELFPRADREKGKLRTFLLTAVTRFLGQQREKANALKRGGGERPLAIDSQEAEQRFEVEANDALPPDEAFEKRWALTVLGNALDALGEEQAAAGRARQWAALRPFLAWNAGAGSQDEAAASLGVTVGAFRAALLRLRRRYRSILTEQIRQTVDAEADLQAEIRHLFQIFSR